MKKLTTNFILFILLMNIYFINAQVGIGTITPTESLDVMGAIAIDHNKTFSNRGQWQVVKNIVSTNWMDITPNALPTGSYLCETTFTISSLSAHLWHVQLTYMLSYTVSSNSWSSNSYYSIPLSISSHHTDNVSFEMRIRIANGHTPSRIQLRAIGNGYASAVPITTKYVKLF